MAELKNLIYEEIKEPHLMGLATITEDNKPWVRYVMGIGNPQLELTFVTSLKSRKISHMKKNNEVHIISGAKDAANTNVFLQIQGRAEISTSQELRSAMWNDQLKTYFSGVDDPDYCVCIIKPYRIEYQTMAEMTPQIWEG